MPLIHTLLHANMHQNVIHCHVVNAYTHLMRPRHIPLRHLALILQLLYQLPRPLARLQEDGCLLVIEGRAGGYVVECLRPRGFLASGRIDAGLESE